jgi:hypothetical protein
VSEPRVSGECMNRVYALLKEMSPEELRLMWEAADPLRWEGALLRHQIFVTVERLASGRWKSERT